MSFVFPGVVMICAGEWTGYLKRKDPELRTLGYLNS